MFLVSSPMCNGLVVRLLTGILRIKSQNKNGIARGAHEFRLAGVDIASSNSSTAFTASLGLLNEVSIARPKRSSLINSIPE